MSDERFVPKSVRRHRDELRTRLEMIVAVCVSEFLQQLKNAHEQ